MQPLTPGAKFIEYQRPSESCQQCDAIDAALAYKRTKHLHIRRGVRSAVVEDDFERSELQQVPIQRPERNADGLPRLCHRAHRAARAQRGADASTPRETQWNLQPPPAI